MRVVLDTNLVVSALVFRGRLARLRTAWQSGAITPVVCRDTALELIRVLGYPKFRLAPEERGALLAEYLPWCEAMALPSPRPATPDCEDRDDLVVLQLAIAAEVAALVSGDAAVAALRGRLVVPVWSGAELLDRLGGTVT